MKPFTTLLLDIDGTLLDFEASQTAALTRVFENHNIPLTKDVLDRYNTINHGLWKDFELGKISRETVLYSRFVTLFDELGIDVDGVAFENQYQELLGEGAYLLDHALEVTEYLSKHYDLIVVTNGVSATQWKRLKASGLDQYMKHIFISEEIGYQKPQVEFFRAVFETVPTIVPEETLIIGDTLSSDILGGNNAGIKTCWYNPKRLPNTTTAHVDLEIHSLEELYQIL